MASNRRDIDIAFLAELAAVALTFVKFSGSVGLCGILIFSRNVL